MLGRERCSLLAIRAVTSFPFGAVAMLLCRTLGELPNHRAPNSGLSSLLDISYMAAYNVSYETKDINNPMTRMKIRRVIEDKGFVCPEICSPDEFMGEEE